jgi:hypothetical protein
VTIGSAAMTPWHLRFIGSGRFAWDDPDGQGRLRLPLPGLRAVAVGVADDRHQAASRLAMISGAVGEWP